MVDRKVLYAFKKRKNGFILSLWPSVVWISVVPFNKIDSECMLIDDFSPLR